MRIYYDKKTTEEEQEVRTVFIKKKLYEIKNRKRMNLQHLHHFIQKLILQSTGEPSESSTLVKLSLFQSLTR